VTVWPGPSVTASLIIPTFNRAAILRRTLEHIASLHESALCQVMVCDDGSSDDTAQVCEELSESLPLEYCRQEDFGFRAGAARNMGIQRAVGDVMIFLDDDCAPLPGFVAAHCAAHEGADDVVALGLRRRLAVDEADVRSLDSSESDARAVYVAAGTFCHPAPWMLFYSCNMSLRRGHPEAHFDEQFVGWGMEDTDLGYRLWRAGTVFRVLENATVVHFDDEEPRDPFRREAIGLEPRYGSYLRNCERLLAKFRGEPDLERSLLRDLQWYEQEPSGRWVKDGSRHDPSWLLGVLAQARDARSWALDRPLDEIAIELSLYCNLSCVMCGVWRGKRHGIPFELARETLRQARELGAMTFTPCGAEVFMRRDTPDLLEYAEEIGFQSIKVVTNSLALNEAKLDRLAAMRTVHLNVSVDGPPEVHDTLRGSGAFARAVRMLREIRAREIPVGLSAVLMRPTIDRVEGVLELALSLGIDEVSLQPYQPEIGGSEVDHDEFRFLPSDEAFLRQRLEEIIAFAGRLGVELYTEHLLDYVPAYLARGKRPIPDGGCFIPSRFLLIDYKGDVYPCFFMRRRAIGNVFQTGLPDLWHSTAQRELNVMALDERCPGCLAACSDVDTYNALAAEATR
jgi:MoaA/NifB/PqqE/SkfB family radical SAM enzyme/glycosyltransferase involved in cell wall biosynthesis